MGRSEMHIRPAAAIALPVTTGSLFAQQFQLGRGSGFLMGAQDHLIANAHVVKECEAVQVFIKGDSFCGFDQGNRRTERACAGAGRTCSRNISRIQRGADQVGRERGGHGVSPTGDYSLETRTGLVIHIPS